MKQGAVVALLVVVVFFVIGVGLYNGLVGRDENVNGAWSEVQNQLKRRSDLIPNVVNTVKGYAAHESGVFEAVTKARASIGQVAGLDPAQLAGDLSLQKKLLDAEQGLSASLGRLIAVAEAYPELKANQNFAKLQDELAGTENRIAVARKRAIDATRDYNRSRRQFPTVILAQLGGFEAKEYYEAPESAQEVPVVDFSE